MKKRLIVLAAGAAMVVGGAVAAIPGGSAHGVTHPCDRLDQAFSAQDSQFSKIPRPPTPQQERGLMKVEFSRFGPGGQLDTACG